MFSLVGIQILLPFSLLICWLFDLFQLCRYKKQAFVSQWDAKKMAEAEELAARMAALEKMTHARLAAEQARKTAQAQEERAAKAQEDAVVVPAETFGHNLQGRLKKILKIIFLSDRRRGNQFLMLVLTISLLLRKFLPLW